MSQTSEIEGLAFASAYVGPDGSVRVHYARCESCMWGQHDGGPHGWAGPEDIAHAKATGQPDPTDQPCGCHCTSDPSREPGGPEDPDFESVDPTICGVCGEAGACGYDAEGRALIHAQEDDDE